MISDDDRAYPPDTRWKKDKKCVLWAKKWSGKEQSFQVLEVSMAKWTYWNGMGAKHGTSRSELEAMSQQYWSCMRRIQTRRMGL